MSSFTQAQLNALEAMIAGGVLESEYDGKRIKYRSMSELIRARDTVKNGLAEGSAISRVTHVNPVFSKGV
jgi:hypothetical protein